MQNWKLVLILKFKGVSMAAAKIAQKLAAQAAVPTTTKSPGVKQLFIEVSKILLLNFLFPG